MLPVLNSALVLAAVAYLLKREEPATRWLMFSMLAARMAGGIGLGLLYRFYYGSGDTFVYFKDATVLADILSSDPVQYLRILITDGATGVIQGGLLTDMPRAYFMVKVTSVASFLTGGNYWVSSLYFSFFAGITAWHFYKTLLAYDEKMKLPGAIAVLFLPSVVFWGSGIVKESLALGALFILAAVFLKLMSRMKVTWKDACLAVLSFFLAWSLKYYWLGVFMPVVISAVILGRALPSFTSIKSGGLKLMIGVACFLLLIALMSLVRPNFNLDRILYVIVENNAAYLKLSAGDGAIHFSTLNPTWYSILENAPWALFSGWFRPALTDARTLLQAFAACENLILLMAFITALSRLKLFFTKFNLLAFSGIVYAAVLSVFLALSAPNFGTLVRYRVGFLPFLALIIFFENPLLGRLKKRNINL